MEALIPALSALASGGLIVGLLRWRPERESYIATASKTTVEAMAQTLSAVRVELAEAEARVAVLEAENAALRAAGTVLRAVA